MPSQIFKRCQQVRANGDQCERELGHAGAHDYDFVGSPFHNNNLQNYEWDGVGKSPFTHSN